jgi:hypothetical protein
MRCANCRADNRDGARFCDKCGAKLSPRCASCGAENRTDARFCDSCGAAFGPDAAVADLRPKPDDTPTRVTETSGAESLEGERKTVTALFADIKGSMELIEDLDPEDARASPGALGTTARTSFHDPEERELSGASSRCRKFRS